MIKKSKLFSRISRSTKKNTHIDEVGVASNTEDTRTVTPCDSDASNTSSVVDKTRVYHYTKAPSEGGYASGDEGEDENDAAAAGQRSHSEPTMHRPKRSTRKRSDTMDESFECIYREDEIQEESREDSPSIPDPSRLRANGQSKVQQSKKVVGQAQVCVCGSARSEIPHLHPSKWPQAPLLLRPQPSGGTRILGIRKEGTSDQYLWKPGQIETWWEVLQKEWGQTPTDDTSADARTTPEYCEYCVILPINNGCEEERESLVVDFESSLFEGTLLLRLRDTNGTTMEPSEDGKGYFADKVIRYQAVLRGRFKTPLAFSNLITGTRLDRPCGKLPPKWVMWTAMKVIHFFAPQLQTQLEKIDKPYVLSPLGSAPRTIVVEDGKTDVKDPEGCNVSKEYEEPTEASTSILGQDNRVDDPLERARARRKLMDQWALAQSEYPRSETDKIYTFEFLQHLFDYQNFTIELGSSFHVKAKDILNGQPLQIMAEHHREGQEESMLVNNKLWSFQIWNECLWNDAMEHLNSKS